MVKGSHLPQLPPFTAANSLVPFSISGRGCAALVPTVPALELQRTYYSVAYLNSDPSCEHCWPWSGGHGANGPTVIGESERSCSRAQADAIANLAAEYGASSSCIASRCVRTTGCVNDLYQVDSMPYDMTFTPPIEYVR